MFGKQKQTNHASKTKASSTRPVRIHFVGIGGIGMSGIAELLINLGYTVSGSDMKETDTTRHLHKIGGQIKIGHDADQVIDQDVVVISSAIPSTNPEVINARKHGIPVIPRAEMLAELMRLKKGIAIAGSHGKTTTTSLVSAILADSGRDPTVVIGGKVNSFGSTSRLGQGEYLVAEADESDGSFMKLAPIFAAVTNIDPEHLDHYGSFENLKQTFVDFLNGVPFYGFGILCLDSEHIQSIIPSLQKRYRTYGTHSQADYMVSDVRSDGMSMRFSLTRRGEVVKDLELNMIGTHNVLNATAAIVIAEALGVSELTYRKSLAEFSGVQRRFTLIGRFSGVSYVDDYAHHPKEIEVTLAGARSAFPAGQIHAIFQPHRYSRFTTLREDFSRAFYNADHVYVMPVYAAGESVQPDCKPVDIARSVRKHGHRQVEGFSEFSEIALSLPTRVNPGDLVISLGAGSVGSKLCKYVGSLSDD